MGIIPFLLALCFPVRFLNRRVRGWRGRVLLVLENGEQLEPSSRGDFQWILEENERPIGFLITHVGRFTRLEVQQFDVPLRDEDNGPGLMRLNRVGFKETAYGRHSYLIEPLARVEDYAAIWGFGLQLKTLDGLKFYSAIFRPAHWDKGPAHARVLHTD